MIQSGSLGLVKSAVFTRLSARPIWSWQNWLMDPRRSGCCALDLHIHGTDFILYLLGAPRAVTSRAVTEPGSGLHGCTGSATTCCVATSTSRPY